MPPRPQMLSAEDEASLRNDAMEWLTRRTNGGAESITYRELASDFQFRGEKLALISTQPGIWKPRGCAGALSIRTMLNSPYADGVGPDNLPRYNWQGADGDRFDNRALRLTMQEQMPLIWLFEVGGNPVQYQPVFPVYAVREERAERRFVVVEESMRGLVPRGDSVVEDQLRRYILDQTRRRLHQPRFRATVLRAYDVRCAVCNLGHATLLDAAHIVGDLEDGGEPVIPNGLALCKIHHAAFDARILGIRPDLMVQIREDILAEVDGPMLRYGLQGLHGAKLMALPRARRERPDPARLTLAYERFLTATP